MNHRLLIAEQVVRQPWILLQRLPNPGDISMPEDSQATREEATLLAVSLDILTIEERDYGLCDRQASCHKAWPRSGYSPAPLTGATSRPLQHHGSTSVRELDSLKAVRPRPCPSSPTIVLRPTIISISLPEASEGPGRSMPNESMRVGGPR